MFWRVGIISSKGQERNFFDDYTLREDVAFADMKRIVKARKKLLQLLNGNKLREILVPKRRKEEVA